VDPSGRVDLLSLPAFVALPTEGRFAGVLPPVSSTKSSSSVFSTSESELESSGISLWSSHFFSGDFAVESAPPKEFPFEGLLTGALPPAPAALPAGFIVESATELESSPAPAALRILLKGFFDILALNLIRRNVVGKNL
jgi:hypothetical protein